MAPPHPPPQPGARGSRGVGFHPAVPPPRAGIDGPRFVGVWDNRLRVLTLGALARLHVPARLAYGSEGAGIFLLQHERHLEAADERLLQMERCLRFAGWQRMKSERAWPLTVDAAHRHRRFRPH